MWFKSIVIAASIVASHAASAESFRLGKGDFVGEHAKQCKGLDTRTWLMRIVDRDPVIVCTRDTMTIQVGNADPLPADKVDGLSAHWRLDEANTLVVSIDPLARPTGVAISIGIVNRASDPECWEKWTGLGVRQPEPKP